MADALWFADPHRRTRVCSVLCQMLEDRGYQLVMDDNHLTVSEQRTLREMPIVGINDDGDLVAVDYCPEPKMSVKSLRHLVETLNACSRLECIISVVHDSVTHFAVREQLDEHRLHIFKYHELMYNVTRNVLVPEHRALTPDEATAVLARTRARVDQIPQIYDDDPVVRYHGWPVGTMISVLRHMLGQTQMYYRIVHPAPTG